MMIDPRLRQILESTEPASVTRFYRDDERDPALVVQRDGQGVRVMHRSRRDPLTWRCAWFSDDGEVLSIEAFGVSGAALDGGQAYAFLSALEDEPLRDLAREAVALGLTTVRECD